MFLFKTTLSARNSYWIKVCHIAFLLLCTAFYDVELFYYQL